MKAVKTALIILGICLLLPVGAFADDTSDAIEQGLSFYKKGKINKAIGELDFALAQLRQKKAEALYSVLPKAPDGWKANKDKNTTAGAGILGGGISATRTYRQTKGRGQVEIQIMSDSPMLASMAAMLQNPAFVQANQGAKLIRFQGTKAVLTSKTDKRAELQTMINNKMLFKVTVNRVAGAAEVAKKFGKLVDFDELGKFAQ
jgi:hypothetical protein